MKPCWITSYLYLSQINAFVIKIWSGCPCGLWICLMMHCVIVLQCIAAWCTGTFHSEASINNHSNLQVSSRFRGFLFFHNPRCCCGVCLHHCALIRHLGYRGSTQILYLKLSILQVKVIIFNSLQKIGWNAVNHTISLQSCRIIPYFYVYITVQKSWITLHFFIFSFQATWLFFNFLKWFWAVVLKAFWRSFNVFWGHCLLFHQSSVQFLQKNFFLNFLRPVSKHIHLSCQR